MRKIDRSLNLFNERYKGDSGHVSGPTVQEWFASITAPEFMLGEYAKGNIEILFSGM